MADSGSRLSGLTQLLRDWSQGHAFAGERVMRLVDRKLRRRAHFYMARERSGHPLQPTALVNEAIVRLLQQPMVMWQNRSQFFAVIGRFMKWTLLDYGRRDKSGKRTHLEAAIDIETVPADPARSLEDLFAIRQAVEKLATLDPRQVEIFKLCHFDHLTIKEIARKMRLSRATINRELATARLFVKGTVNQARS